jgi:hypothetical protein
MRTIRFRQGAGLLLLALTFSTAGSAAALCTAGYPNISLSRELKESDFVIIGTLMSYRRVVDPEDPEGYEATLYQVHVDRALRGQVRAYARKAYLTVYNENTSARFPFDEPPTSGKGKRYLMLVRSGPDGYWVDACGHSGELEQSRKTVRLIQGMAVPPTRQ